jgi:hypothetical protein
VRIVGVAFEDSARALEALDELRHTLAIEPPSVDVRPLGTTDYSAPPETDAILAGWFAPEIVPHVEELVEAHGGRVVVVRDESPYLGD